MEISSRRNVNIFRCVTIARHAMNEAAQYLRPASDHRVELTRGFIQHGQVTEQIASGFARSSNLTALTIRSRRPR
jgi:hypothetical protein